jgi:K+ transporter
VLTLGTLGVAFGAIGTSPSDRIFEVGTRVEI